VCGSIARKSASRPARTPKNPPQLGRSNQSAGVVRTLARLDNGYFFEHELGDVASPREIQRRDGKIRYGFGPILGVKIRGNKI
jgi:hypothetical protein